MMKLNFIKCYSSRKKSFYGKRRSVQGIMKKGNQVFMSEFLRYLYTLKALWMICIDISNLNVYKNISNESLCYVSKWDFVFKWMWSCVQTFSLILIFELNYYVHIKNRDTCKNDKISYNN